MPQCWKSHVTAQIFFSMNQKQLVIGLLHEKTGTIKLEYVEIYHNILLYVEVLISTIHVDNFI